MVGEDVGGSGPDGRSTRRSSTRKLAQGCTSTTAYISIHNIGGRGCSTRSARMTSAAAFLPKLCAMEHFASYCLTEPGAGSDAASLATRARRARRRPLRARRRQGLHLPARGTADIYVCMVRTGGAGPKGISCIVVEKGTPGLSFGAQEKKLGWKSQPTAMVMFENCRVPAANLIGAEGQGFSIAMGGARRAGGSASRPASLGGAQFCLDRTVAYMRERKQFGSRLSDFQALRFFASRISRPKSRRRG